MSAVKNISCQNFLCSLLNVIIFVSFFLRVAYILGSCVDCKSITYVERPSFCISEWLAAFSFVIFFYFLVSFDEAVETNSDVVQSTATYISVGSEHNVLLVIQFFTVANKHDVVQVRITCGLCSSVSEEFTVCIFRRHSEDGHSLFPQNSIHSKLCCFCEEGNNPSASSVEMRL